MSTPSSQRQRRRLGGTLAALAISLLLAWLVGYPLLVTALEALGGPANPSLAAFRDLVRRPDEWQALWRSLWISLASVVAAAALGVPLGFLFGRGDFPGRRTLAALLTLPVALPPLVGVMAFLFLWGESGFAARAVQAALGLTEPPWRLAGWPAILLVHTYSFYVYFFLFTRAGLARLDPSLREAAAALGASRSRTLFAVTLPALRPALAGATLLTFLTALASFSAPYLFGGGFRVMTTQIVASRLNGNHRLAMAESLLLAALALFALVFSGQLAGAQEVAASGHGVAPRARRLRGLTGALVAVAGWLLAIFLLLPHATLLLLSLVPTGTWMAETLPPRLDFSNYRMLADAERWRPVAGSFWMAALSTVAALALGLVAARLARRGGRLRRGALEGLLGLPWAVPGTVFAVALAVTFSVDAPAALRFVLVGTPWLLPLAYLLRSLPLTGRAAVAGLRQLDPALEEAAASLGAGRARTLLRVVLPLLRPALAAGAGLAFVTALGDFVTSILLYTWDNRPIAMEILESLRLQETGLAAVYGVLLAAASTAALLLWGEREPR
ncbi:MAG TPA: ABC transporter permease subunit [Thermoanaerobaculia bacterium]|nr:ABC transporter permease subunit [Thermoanaerobaculia bacterium]